MAGDGVQTAALEAILLLGRGRAVVVMTIVRGMGGFPRNDGRGVVKEAHGDGGAAGQMDGDETVCIYQKPRVL